MAQRLSGLDVPVVSVAPEFRTYNGQGGSEVSKDLAKYSGGIALCANDLTLDGRPDWRARREILRDAANLSRTRYLLVYEPLAQRADQVEQLSMMFPDSVTSGSAAWVDWRFKPFDPTAVTSGRVLGYRFLK
jgi:hypothetical protein